MRRIPRWLIFSLIIIAMLTGVFTLWRRSLNTTPRIVIPKVTNMPSPNAFDYFVDAGKLVVDKKTIQEMFMDPSSRSGKRTFTLADYENILRINATALTKLKEGLRYECRWPRTNSLEYNRWSDIRSILFILVIKERFSILRCDWNDAVQTCLDNNMIGEILPNGGGLVAIALSRICFNNVNEDLWKIIQHLDVKQIKTTLNRLYKIDTLHVPIHNIIKEQKWADLSELANLLKQPNWRGYILEGVDFVQHSDNELSLAIQLIRYDGWKTGRAALLCSKSDVLIEYIRAIDEWIIYTKRPYHSRGKQPKEPKNIYSQIMTRDALFNGLFFGEAKNKTLRSQFMLALARRAYRLERGRYPDRLQELAPSYLKNIPNDTFTGKAFHYSRKGDRYLLYSIGPDGKDDGGKPIMDSRWIKYNRQCDVDWNSKGDIVAGVNVK